MAIEIEETLKTRDYTQYKMKNTPYHNIDIIIDKFGIILLQGPDEKNILEKNHTIIQRKDFKELSEFILKKIGAE